MRFFRLALPPSLLALAFSCSATGNHTSLSGGSASGTGGTGGAGECNTCLGNVYTPCPSHGGPGTPVKCTTGACAPGLGCVACVPGDLFCVGDAVHKCAADGKDSGQVVE